MTLIFKQVSKDDLPKCVLDIPFEEAILHLKIKLHFNFMYRSSTITSPSKGSYMLGLEEGILCIFHSLINSFKFLFYGKDSV